MAKVVTAKLGQPWSLFANFNVLLYFHAQSGQVSAVTFKRQRTSRSFRKLMVQVSGQLPGQVTFPLQFNGANRRPEVFCATSQVTEVSVLAVRTVLRTANVTDFRKLAPEFLLKMQNVPSKGLESVCEMLFAWWNKQVSKVPFTRLSEGSAVGFLLLAWRVRQLLSSNAFLISSSCWPGDSADCVPYTSNRTSYRCRAG